LYIGLAVMCGFIVYDTQFIVERARRGDMDYVMHSLNLFVDFVGVFWRLLMILTNKVISYSIENGKHVQSPYYKYMIREEFAMSPYPVIIDVQLTLYFFFFQEAQSKRKKKSCNK